MPYEAIPIAHVLNHLLADGFDASGETDVIEWLGDGKTIADMLGEEASHSFYTPERIDEIAKYIKAYDLMELQYYLNDNDATSAVVLQQQRNGEFVFVGGNPEGTAAIQTDWFKRDRSATH